MMRFLILLLAVVAAAGAAAEVARCDQWKRLTPLPDAEGFAGAFAGVSHGTLLVAGGANFPTKKPWEDGKKVWYDSVFALEQPNGAWKKVGKLPRPLGYGVSVTHGDGVVCVGGSDAGRHYADVFRLELVNGRHITTSLPALPIPLANASGALVGSTLFVAGGQEEPDSKSTSKATWCLDLSAAGAKWKEIEPCPGGGRMLAVAASDDKAFWLMGGVDLFVGHDGKVQRRYLKDAYRYEPGHGWTQLPDLPHPVAAAPSPAPVDASGVYLLGGDDGSQVGSDPRRHRGFNQQVIRFDRRSAKWVEAGDSPAPRVTVPCVEWRDVWVIPSGEMRPGVRSPKAWGFAPGRK
jgi:N-acetylneuraminic acid mutarotase